MSVQPPTVHQSMPDAEVVLATKGRTFYWARYLLGRVYGGRATRLYGFCRHLDDLVDEASSTDEARQALAVHRCALLSGYSNDPLVGDALALMQQCAIEPIYALELISGVESDLEAVRVADVDELLRYCYKVAGTVGLMMTGVLDVKCERALPHAIDLGIAMQLTNICRDVADDAKLNRRYLPASLLGDLEVSQLIAPDPSIQSEIKQCVKTLLALADQYYKSGEAGLHYLPLNARAAILVAARVYREIGQVLKARDFAYWESRAFVTPPVKFVKTAAALVGTLSNSGFWFEKNKHDSVLHAALKGLPGTSQPTEYVD
ncbi:MAG: phytoene/squalene synthase family protein [Zwartia sp.]